MVLALLLAGACFGTRLDAQTVTSRQPSSELARGKVEKMARAIVRLDLSDRSLRMVPLPDLLYFPFLRSAPAGSSSFRPLLNVHSGMGFLIDSEGYILCNAFLVNGTRKIRVRLWNGKFRKASVLGSDAYTDLALLKIEGLGPFPWIPSGDSDRVEIGQHVFTIRSPSVPPSISKGIVCARLRKGVITPASFQDFIQTDLRVGIENSGTPLLNGEGKIVGITDALLTRRAGFEGIGFAVPWNMAAYVIHQIRAHGKVERGWLGIGVQDVLLRSRRNPHRFIRGVMVVEIRRDGPGQAAGLQPGDVILRYGGQPVPESSVLKHLVSNTPVGQITDLLVLRKGHRQKIRVTVGTREKERKGIKRSVLSRRLGIEVVPLNGWRRGVSSRVGGVVITRIDADSPMERAGFEIDDLIIEANSRLIRSDHDLEEVLRGLRPGQHITFLAVDHRTNRMGYVQVRPR